MKVPIHDLIDIPTIFEDFPKKKVVFKWRVNRDVPLPSCNDSHIHFSLLSIYYGPLYLLNGVVIRHDCNKTLFRFANVLQQIFLNIVDFRHGPAQKLEFTLTELGIGELFVILADYIIIMDCRVKPELILLCQLVKKLSNLFT